MNEEENKKAQSKGKRWIIIGAAVAAVIVIVTIVLLATGVWGHKDLTNTETTTEKNRRRPLRLRKKLLRNRLSRRQHRPQTSNQYLHPNGRLAMHGKVETHIFISMQ